ncbi:zinc finger RNA-binding protein-like isoform X2 [Pecten maximus]|uniref:zinc finger RNA-binding protein-like isoform X2 n=1 Tax=Pecten maximus TaxID=6579 RepID=UPI001457FA59|nr:zinc finger RNA-binding protein-like isoform X2 [Pecten maximus]
MAHFVYPAANAQPAAAYPTVQTAYVAAAPQAAYATAAPRAGQAYDSYQTAHATPQYAYTTRTQVAVTPAATYDQKAYYQPAAPSYTAAETHYQPAAAAKPVYTTGAAYSTQRAAAPKAQTQVQVSSAPTYVYPTNSTPAVTTYASNYATNTTSSNTTAYTTKASTGSNYNTIKQTVQPVVIKGYDAALYSAATSYYQQQQAAKTPTGTWQLKKQGQQVGKPKPKVPPKQPQLHYCDVCKISCAGPQTYREHLEGQKHKKKEAAMKSGNNSQPVGRGGQNQLRCELCDVTCTGADAYAAHIRGSKHQKVLKLHTRLGKPIPSTDPVIVSPTSAGSSTTAKTGTSATSTTATATKPTTKPAPVVTTQPTITKKVLSTPKITFVGGTQLKTLGTKPEEVKVEPKIEPMAASASLTDDDKEDEDGDKLNILGEKDVAPVGHEYIEEVKNEQGKTISFNCKLCECKFNDPNAKEMHMKGRRHRLQYKKKVDPSLNVEVKPSIRARKIQEEKIRRQAQKEEYWRRREQEQRWRDEMRMEDELYWEERRRYEDQEYFEWQRQGGRPGMGPPRPFLHGPGGPHMFQPMRRPDSSDDRHVMAKHVAIYPNEVELQAVQNIVSLCEKSLKQVSDFLTDSINPKSMDIDKDAAKKESDSKEGDKKEDPLANRVLKGVMRVGVLAKGLLLHGDLNVHLVVLCSEKPTRTLLERVADGLPKQIAAVTEETYEVRRCVEEAAIIVTNNKEPKTTCSITLTSPVMREAQLSDGETSATVSVKDPPDVLDRQKCLDALAALRHAKWFQARANGLQSCVVVIRILRDLCQRVPTWTPLNEWAMELLVEKCVSSGGAKMSPGDALRRVFECLASGLLLPGGPGLYDPCEKDPADAAASLTPQEREDITASAQHALRLIAFRQIHKVLGMDQLPAPKFQRQRMNPRKRRRMDSATGEGDEVGEKKDKKDEDQTMETADGKQ